MVKRESGRKEAFGPRMQKRLEARSYYRRQLKIVFFVITLFLIFLITSLSVENLPLLTSSLKKPSKSLKAPPPLEKRMTFLIIGVQRVNSKEETLGLLVAFLDFGLREVKAISLPKDVFVEIPQDGFEKISKALNFGIPTLLVTAGNLLGLKIEHYLKLGYSDFEQIVTENQFEKAFVKAILSDLTEKERLRISKNLSKQTSKADVFPLPVRAVSIGEKVYVQPKKEEIKELLGKIWEKEPPSQKQVRVIVLNGSGVPGVAGKVGKRLSEKGYKVVDIKNADNFNYKKTRIEVYKKVERAAQKIKKLLKVGEIISRNVPQDVTDITIVVGKDY